MNNLCGLTQNKPFPHKLNTAIKLALYKRTYIACLALLGIGFGSNIGWGQHLKPLVDIPNHSAENAANLSELNTSICAGFSAPDTSKIPLLTNIKNLEKRHSLTSDIAQIKLQKTKEKLSAGVVKSNGDPGLTQAAAQISVSTNFQGNMFNGGSPPDNTIAVANNGNLVSVINCNVAYYNSAGSQLWTGSFWELFNDPSLNEIIYDPVVIYDHQQDKFVMIAIHGFTAATSKLIVCFSKTNNPVEGWFIYKLSGNPLNNSCWFDYPKLGISNNEIFVTGNLFEEASGFNQAVIYQINKGNGFNGANLSWKIWSNIAGSPTTVIPVSFGQQGTYGPGLYFINQSPGSGNAVNLYEITNDLASNPKLTRNQIFKTDYEPSGNAEQNGSAVQLITADCRILNAFYLDGIIHYVFQSDYQNSNYSGINYNRLNVKTLTNVSYTYGEIGYDCAYPSVASFATSATDKTVIFCFLRSNGTIYPETRAVVFDQNQSWSNSILVKAGVNFVDAFQTDNTVRWGDYTGIAYKYNPDKPEVWVSGCYGSKQKLFNATYNCFNTWIAQINTSVLHTANQTDQVKPSISVFPNPTINIFSVDFYSATDNAVCIDIIDPAGKLVRRLFQGHPKIGENLLTFNSAFLPKGIYWISIHSNNKAVRTEKLLVE